MKRITDARLQALRGGAVIRTEEVRELVRELIIFRQSAKLAKETARVEAKEVTQPRVLPAGDFDGDCG